MKRRRLLGGLCTLGIGMPALSQTGSADDATASAAPQAGDLLAFAFGSREGEVISPDDLAIGDEQVFAYPMDPVSGVMRNGNRLNQAVVIRLNTEWLSDETLARSADGVVAYSGVCTHTGCDIELWNAEMNRFQCPCHESQFDPSDGAKVVGGPAPQQLAALPLALDDGRLVVTGDFIGRVGFQQPGFNSFGL
jgi:rieske iron-sulfur protein